MLQSFRPGSGAVAAPPCVPARADDVAAVPVVVAPPPRRPVPPCGPSSDAAPVEPAAAGNSGRFATLATFVMSPRTSIEVSCAGPYAMPPGARMLLPEIAETTSPRTSPEEARDCGSTYTSIAGVTVPLALTLETPSICSISGTKLFVTIDERAAAESERDVTASVTTVAWPGSNVRTFGGDRSVGMTDIVDCTRRCTSTRSVV